MEKMKKKTGKFGNMFLTSGTRNGSYSVGLTVIVIAIIIVLNLVIGQLPESMRNIDVSSTKIYEISDTTTELLDGLEEDVDMTVLAIRDDTDDRITTQKQYPVSHNPSLRS